MLFHRSALVVFVAAAATGCATGGHLTTSTGRPEIRVSRSWLKRLPVAIASFTLNNGRHLDEARRDALVTYDGVKTADGNIEVRSKTVYNILDMGDSVTLTSSRLMTDDLDDDDVSEALDQATLDEQQQELQQIIAALAKDIAADTLHVSTNGASSAHTQ